jgi:hypothetical protein
MQQLLTKLGLRRYLKSCRHRSSNCEGGNHADNSIVIMTYRLPCASRLF